VCECQAALVEDCESQGQTTKASNRVGVTLSAMNLERWKGMDRKHEREIVSGKKRE
jgi:hypothetical protein